MLLFLLFILFNAYHAALLWGCSILATAYTTMYSLQVFFCVVVLFTCCWRGGLGGLGGGDCRGCCGGGVGGERRLSNEVTPWQPSDSSSLTLSILPTNSNTPPAYHPLQHRELSVVLKAVKKNSKKKNKTKNNQASFTVQ